MLSASSLIRFRGLTLLSVSFLTVWFYFTNDPALFKVGVPCLLHAATGWECWGCGGQRAFHQLLHGNITTAFRLNPLVFPVIILGSYMLISELTQSQPDYSWLRKKHVGATLAAIVFSFTLLRNII